MSTHAVAYENSFEIMAAVERDESEGRPSRMNHALWQKVVRMSVGF